jgi:hypothetical protein
MDYQGKHAIFDCTRIRTYPVGERDNKVTLSDLIDPAHVLVPQGTPSSAQNSIDRVAQHIVEARQAQKPVILFTGAHLIKNGLSLLIIDLVKRGVITHVAGNGATAIHDFELALMGQTSENVPHALGQGQFGMAYEFAYLNQALRLGDKQRLGMGEALGRMICDSGFRTHALCAEKNKACTFIHPEISILAACHQQNIPFTVHVGIGTDVIDQHPSFDGCAKGGCSGRDFLIYTQQITRLTQGGVILNVGSAVTGPEVLLKAVSMAANAQAAPQDITCADFDLRAYHPEHLSDEAAAGYYCRDQKSIVTRIPQAFSGTGLYVQGDQIQTIPLLYRHVTEKL